MLLSKMDEMDTKNDQLVYELFGLTNQKIEILENS